MKALFDQLSQEVSKKVTTTYSTSFSIATKLLSPQIRQDIYNIYGFVRLVDEIVDSFHNFDKEYLINDFEKQLYAALDYKVSMNPVLNAFQKTVHEYQIDYDHIDAFMSSMKSDLHLSAVNTVDQYKQYIYGSADVVGLMCLQVFVKGDKNKYELLKPYAMRLGSAFQKVNFLRDVKDDFEALGRSYFPNTNIENLSEEHKYQLIAEIKEDFDSAYEGIKKLPVEARLGVYVAYRYYMKLLRKIERTPAQEILKTRIRVSDYQKIIVLGKSYVDLKFIKVA